MISCCCLGTLVNGLLLLVGVRDLAAVSVVIIHLLLVVVEVPIVVSIIVPFVVPCALVLGKLKLVPCLVVAPAEYCDLGRESVFEYGMDTIVVFIHE